METIISNTEKFVEKKMSGFDASHNYKHVQRVVRLAQHIAKAEEARTATEGSPIIYDHDLLTLGALLHDVWDKKYLEPGTDLSNIPSILAKTLGLSEAQATQVDDIITHVSYTTEMKDPPAVLAALDRNPELGPVQDADRLDAIGAVGVGRCFTYNAAWHARRRAEGEEVESVESMEEAIDHYEFKLLKLEGRMKTVTGREMARVKTERLKVFRGWWREEMDFGM